MSIKKTLAVTAVAAALSVGAAVPANAWGGNDSRPSRDGTYKSYNNVIKNDQTNVGVSNASSYGFFSYAEAGNFQGNSSNNSIEVD